MKAFSTRFLLIIPVLLLSACGGGGGGSSTTAPATPLRISVANSLAVAADALDNSIDTTTARTGTSLVTGVQVDGGPTAGPRKLVSVGRTLLALVPPRPALATGVVVDDTAACNGGGSLRVVGTVADPTGNTLSAGDQVTLIANACSAVIDGQATAINGSLAIAINTGSFNPNAVSYPAHIVMTFTTNNFSVAIGAETLVSNGDLRIDLTMNSATSEDILLSGSSLAESHGSSAGTRSSILKNYNETLLVRDTGIIASITATVESTNIRLGRGAMSYTISTVTSLTYTEAGDVSAGVLKVTGSNSALLLTVTATNAFRVEVDANGDGTYESSATTTRAELESLL